MKKSLIVLLTLALGVSAYAQLPSKAAVANSKMPRVTQKLKFNGTKELKNYLEPKSTELKASFTCLTESSEVTTWSENFDKGTTGWTFDNNADVPWITKKISGTITDYNKDFALIDSTDVKSLFVEGPYQIFKRATCAATSPEFNVPSNGSFLGYVGYTLNYDDECRLLITISTDNFASCDTLWNSGNETGDKPWRWRKFNVSLNKYSGMTAKVKFVYAAGKKDMFNTGGYMGDFAIDGLKVVGRAPIDNISVSTGEKIKFLDLSQGNPTAWQWNFPGAETTTSTEQNPEVFYTRDGVYDVSLTVSNGTGNNLKTITSFVKVEGKAPIAHIEAPAMFKSLATFYHMVAPLTDVQYKDASENYPTEWNWKFSGVDNDGTQLIMSQEQDPIVGYNFLHKQTVQLQVSNSHGSSLDNDTVSVEYEGPISNLCSTDNLNTFSLEDKGTFPGSNKMKITAYAEKFSKPSRPIRIDGVYAFFTEAKATALADQIADIGVHLYTSKNGLPDKKIDSWWWRVMELETSSAMLLPTTFTFTSRPVVDDEFFIVVDGMPVYNDSTNVALAMADFRGTGNTTYMLKDDKWVDVSTYFPAGANCTSLALVPYITHSVMSSIPTKNNKLEVGKNAGVKDFVFFSYNGYKMPISSTGNWCRVTSVPNGLTLDTLKISYDALPVGINERSAVLTITDSLSTYEVTLTQKYEGGVSAVINEGAKVYPTLFESNFTVTLPAGSKEFMVVNMEGKNIYNRKVADGETSVVVDTQDWASGTYLVKIIGGTEVNSIKCVRK